MNAWDGHICWTNAVKHLVKLTSCIFHPIHMAHYQPWTIILQPWPRWHWKIGTNGRNWASANGIHRIGCMKSKEIWSCRLMQQLWKSKKVSLRDSYALSRMVECIDSRGGSWIFSRLDAILRFWRANLDEEDRDGTEFYLQWRLYSFVRRWFSLKMPLRRCNLFWGT